MAIETPISDEDVALTMLASVSGPYDNLVVSLETLASTQKLTSDFVEARLLGEEKRRLESTAMDARSSGVESALYSGSVGGTTSLPQLTYLNIALIVVDLVTLGVRAISWLAILRDGGREERSMRPPPGRTPLKETVVILIC